jgi:hypothetical protein
MQSALAAVSAAAKLEWIKYNVIDPVTGRYADPTQSHTFNVVPPTPGLYSPGPPQLTMAISLLTDQARGRGHAGRVYPPSGGLNALGADGRMAVLDTQNSANAFRTLLMAIQTAGSTDIVIYSKAAQSFTAVTKTSVGRVLDTQRRRRSSLSEERWTSPVF